MTPAEHFLAWLTPERYELLNANAFDRHAERATNTFARFLKREKYVTMERAGLTEYYPYLRLVGYLPPVSVWEPTEPLSAAEASTDLREWFTPLRKQLINLAAIDRLSSRAPGLFGRFLNREPRVSLKYVGEAVYHPVLKLLGYVPPP